MEHPINIRAATNDDEPSLHHLDHIARIENERKELIRAAIKEQRAWVILSGTTEIVGYGVLSHGFFGRTFVELVYIDEQYRSSGYGPAIIEYLEQHSRSADLFTSTNESNTHMQHVLAKLGYLPSGTIFNLDPGDPELVYVKTLRS